MRLKIVNYAIAKLAKEKGFRRKVLGFYLCIHQNEMCEEYTEFNDYDFPKNLMNNLRNDFNSIVNDYGIEYISAPSLHELQEWLREEHRIHVNPEYVAPDTNKYYWRIDSYKTNEYGRFSNSRGYIKEGYVKERFDAYIKECYVKERFDAYDQCLEDGILEAFEMINKVDSENRDKN